MPPWEYTDIKTNHMPTCPRCEKPDDVKRWDNFDAHPRYVCDACGTTFVAVWRPA